MVNFISISHHIPESKIFALLTYWLIDTQPFNKQFKVKLISYRENAFCLGVSGLHCILYGSQGNFRNGSASTQSLITAFISRVLCGNRLLWTSLPLFPCRWTLSGPDVVWSGVSKHLGWERFWDDSSQNPLASLFMPIVGLGELKSPKVPISSSSKSLKPPIFIHCSVGCTRLQA